MYPETVAHIWMSIRECLACSTFDMGVEDYSISSLNSTQSAPLVVLAQLDILRGFIYASLGNICDASCSHINPNINGIVNKSEVSLHLGEPPMRSRYKAPKILSSISNFNPPTSAPLGMIGTVGCVNEIDSLVGLGTTFSRLYCRWSSSGYCWVHWCHYLQLLDDCRGR